MTSKPVTAKGGEPYRYRLDQQTVMLLDSLKDEAQERLCVRPSHTVLIRRALRHYAKYLMAEGKSIRQLQAEKAELYRAAGRKPKPQVAPPATTGEEQQDE
jgi:deoxyribodipyrimidine photolyase-like uncharacterized protein